MQKNSEWFTKLIDKFQLNQSWLTINVSDVSQLSELSKDQIAFFMDMVKLMRSDLPESQLAKEILSLGPREVEENVRAIDVVISRSQQVGLQFNTINHQVNLNPTQHIQQQTANIGTQYNFFGTTGSSNTSSTTLKSDGPFRDCFGLPPEFEDFTGREDSLALLEASAGQSTIISHPKKTVSGTGGIGKTQLAVIFAHSKLKQYRETQGKVGYRSIIWFIAGTDEGINNEGLMTEQMNRLGQQLGFDSQQLNLKALVKLIFQRLSEEYGPCLVVYDNAHDFRSIKAYLPPSTVPVIITTRNSNEGDWGQTFKAISLSVFTEKEAHNYIKKVLCRNHENLYREDEANALAKALGYFPLALTQALAYITTENIRITEYLEKFAQQKKKYLKKPVPQEDPYQEDKNPAEDTYAALPKEKYDRYKATVWAVIQLSLEKVASANANQILKACAYLAPEAPIDVKLLAYCSTNKDESRDALGTLRCYSLIENSSAAGHVRVHQLVQEIVRLVDDDETQRVWLKRVTGFMSQHYAKEENPFADEARQKALFPHLQAVLKHFEGLKEGYTQFEQEFAKLQFYVGSLNCVMGNAVQSARCFEVALGILERANDEYLIAKTLMRLGNSHYKLGDPGCAKLLYERALAIFVRINGPGDSEVAGVLTNLGNVTLDLSGAASAKVLYERALAIYGCIYNAEHPQLATILLNLGNVILELDDAEGARVMLERALTITERTFDPEHPEMATILMSLGSVYFQLSNVARAKTLYDRALRIKERAFGPDHPEVARTLRNIGSVTRELGNAEGAKVLYERALTIQESFFGPKHTEVAKTLGNLGNVISELGDIESARALFERALAIEEHTYESKEHSALATALVNLGVACFKLGDALYAKKLLERALVINQHVYGTKHTEVATTLMNLGNTHLALNDAASAEELYERALAIRIHILGQDHLETAHTRYNLAHALNDLGQRETALIHFQHCASVFSHHYGKQAQLTHEAQSLVVELQEIVDQRIEIGFGGI